MHKVSSTGVEDPEATFGSGREPELDAGHEVAPLGRFVDCARLASRAGEESVADVELSDGRRPPAQPCR